MLSGKLLPTVCRMLPLRLLLHVSCLLLLLHLAAACRCCMLVLHVVSPYCMQVQTKLLLVHGYMLCMTAEFYASFQTHAC